MIGKTANITLHWRGSWENAPHDYKKTYEEFRLTQTQGHKGTLTSALKKENLEKVDHSQRLFFSLFGWGLFK